MLWQTFAAVRWMQLCLLLNNQWDKPLLSLEGRKTTLPPPALKTPLKSPVAMDANGTYVAVQLPPEPPLIDSPVQFKTLGQWPEREDLLEHALLKETNMANPFMLMSPTFTKEAAF